MSERRSATGIERDSSQQQGYGYGIEYDLLRGNTEEEGRFRYTIDLLFLRVAEGREAIVVGRRVSTLRVRAAARRVAGRARPTGRAPMPYSKSVEVASPPKQRPHELALLSPPIATTYTRTRYDLG